MVRHVVVTKIDWDNPINTTPPERNLGLVVDHAQSSMCINKYVYIYIYLHIHRGSYSGGLG